MKNLFSLSLLFVLSFVSISNLVAQEDFVASPLIGRSLNQAEMQRINIERVVPLWQDNYPDSLIILESLDSENLSLLSFRGQETEGEVFILPEFKKQQILRLIRTETASLERSFQDIEIRLQTESTVAIVAEMYSGDNLFLEISTVADGYLEGVYRDQPVRIGWWEFEQIRIQEESTGSRTLYNPNATRYLFAPSAIPLKKREGYYQNVLLGLNSINYGLTKHVSVTAGTEIATLVYGVFNGGVVNGFVNVKVAGKVAEKVHVGGGVLTGGLRDFSSDSGLGGTMGYGIVTYGSAKSNMSFSAAMGRANGEWAKNPVFVLSGMHQINNKIGLVTENWVIRSRPNFGYRSTSIAMSGGIRLLVNNISVDLGLVGLANYSRYLSEDPYKISGFRVTPIPLPFVGLVYKFQK